ncbi:hypothetical protein [Methanothermobacter sp. DP]|uniref:hypothetical protein n=1 Tax=Methanothermobacter sp. DP TaxID=2998972 RepID=UPI002AA504E4|nr:hypothetical protein [Methanothermobacter sp. DP]
MLGSRIIIGCILFILVFIGCILLILGGLGERKKRLDFLLYGVIGGVLLAIGFFFVNEGDVGAFAFLIISFIFLNKIGKLNMEWLAKSSIILVYIFALTMIILNRILIGIFALIVATLLIKESKTSV